MTKKNTTQKPFTVTFEAHGGDRLKDRNRRKCRVSYPKWPNRWTGADLLKLAQMMADKANGVKGTPPDTDELTLQLHEHSITVNQGYGAWATVEWKWTLPRTAVADVIAVSKRYDYFNGMLFVRADALNPATAAAVEKKRRRMLAMLDQMRATYLAEQEAADTKRKGGR